MEASGPQIPAGWYSDPSGDGLRYWDGVAWTEHTHAAPTPAPAAQPAGEQGSGAGGGQSAGRGAASQQPSSTGGGPPGQGPPGTTGAAAGQGSAGTTGAAGAAASPARTNGTAPKRGPSNLEWGLSVLLAVVPPVGLAWGVYLIRAKDGRETAGNVAIVLSLAVVLLIVLAVQL